MNDHVRIAVLAPHIDKAITASIIGVEVVTPAEAGGAAAACRGAHIVFGDYTGEHRVTEDLAAILEPTCRLVQVASAGLDSVDVEACRRHGIPVGACIGTNSDTVAEWCIWAILDGLRGLSRSAAALSEGRWEQLGPTRYELRDKRVGIIGLGSIGTEVARRLPAFGVRIGYWSRTRRDATTEQDLGAVWNELDDLFSESDVVVLACALTDDTRGLVDAARLAMMKPTAVLVNASRGEVVDQRALRAALAAGQLHAAVLDVFDTEPIDADDPLRLAPQLTGTPHVAGVTVESVQRTFGQAMANVAAAVRGEPLVGLV